MSKERANERINNSMATNKNKRSHTGLLIIISVAIICILTGIILYLLLGKESKDYNTVVTPDNVEQVISQLSESEYTPVGSYQVNMNTEWSFPNGKSASTNAYVGNSTNNRNTVFFTIVLKDDTTNEIYKSPLLPIGSHLENIKLDKELGAGTYDAIVTYHLVDDSEKEISTVSVSITITINK